MFRILEVSNVVGSKPNPDLVGKELGKVDRSYYLGTYISPIGRVSDDVSSHIQKYWFAHSNAMCL